MHTLVLASVLLLEGCKEFEDERAGSGRQAIVADVALPTA